MDDVNDGINNTNNNLPLDEDLNPTPTSSNPELLSNANPQQADTDDSTQEHLANLPPKGRDLRHQAINELAIARNDLRKTRQQKILKNLRKERVYLSRLRRHAKSTSSSESVVIDSLRQIPTTGQPIPKLPTEVTPPSGIQWVRARTNVRLPGGFEPSFFIPFLDDNEENLVKSSVVADEVYEGETDAEDDSDIEGRVFDDTAQRRSSRRVVRSGKRKVADLIWERAAKRVAIHRLIQRVGGRTDDNFVNSIVKAFRMPSEHVVTGYLKIINNREEVWKRREREKDQTALCRKDVINLVRGKKTVTPSGALRGDSIPYFFCRRCYVFSCPLHPQGEHGPMCKIPDKTRKDSAPKTTGDTIEVNCIDSKTNRCWFSRPENAGVEDESEWWETLQEKSEEFASDIKMLLTELLPIYGDDYCRVSDMIRILIRDVRDASVVTCERMGFVSTLSYRGLLPKAESQKVKSNKVRVPNPRAEARAMNEGKRPDYTPCRHEGPCTAKNCHCVKNGVHCEKYCGCNHNRPSQPRNVPPCSWAFRGCSCKSTVACISKACVCFSWKRECDPDLCKSCHDCKPSADGLDASISCRNVGLQHNKGHRTVAGKSDIHGWGLFSTGDIGKNEIVGEYVGEIIEDQDAERRGRVYDFLNSNFLFDMTTNYSLDSSRLGNKLRYCNHSSVPNCEARLMRVNGDIRVGIFARSNIKKYEELLFDYGAKFADTLKKKKSGNRGGKKKKSGNQRGKKNSKRKVDQDDDEEDDDSDMDDDEYTADVDERDGGSDPGSEDVIVINDDPPQLAASRSQSQRRRKSSMTSTRGVNAINNEPSRHSGKRRKPDTDTDTDLHNHIDQRNGYHSSSKRLKRLPSLSASESKSKHVDVIDVDKSDNHNSLTRASGQATNPLQTRLHGNSNSDNNDNANGDANDNGNNYGAMVYESGSNGRPPLEHQPIISTPNGHSSGNNIAAVTLRQRSDVRWPRDVERDLD